MTGSAPSETTGILNVDKPLGMTSHAVVDALRAAFKQRRVGHAGTLDPMATGVLLACLGKATRVSSYLVASRKVYRAAVCLGISTTTDDTEGEITGQAPVDVTREQVEAALSGFVGRIDQVPPAYSAIKRQGVRLYELARQGISVDVPPRKVDVYALQVIDWAPPIVHLRVECGPGTYVRALARDLGSTLGCGAHLAALRRMSSGQFAVEQAVSLEALRTALTAGTVGSYLHPLDAAFAHLPALHLEAGAAYRLAMGQAIAGEQGFAGAADEDLARAYAPGGQFVALVSRDETARAWRPRKVFVEPDHIRPTEH